MQRGLSSDCLAVTLDIMKPPVPGHDYFGAVDPASMKVFLMKAEVFDALVEESKLECRRNCLPQVDALIDAGWRFELPATKDSEPWQWYWRSPPKRKGSKGKFHWSTQQAYNALMKQKKAREGQS